MAKRKPYQERTDLEKIKSQWRKLSGLHSREEWSAAVVRAATAVEIAANLVIRKELQSRSDLDETFVNHLLKWANGIVGKMDRLLLPLFVGRKQHSLLKKQTKVVEVINEKRNAIVHRGEFCNETEAREVIGNAKTFVESLVRIHEPNFKLKEKS